MLALGYNPLICLVISGTGNTFGGWLNYFIGYLGNKKWLLRIVVTIYKIEDGEHEYTSMEFGLHCYLGFPSLAM
jgi:membrane protein YqaA with SNARE-associated domain